MAIELTTFLNLPSWMSVELTFIPRTTVSYAGDEHVLFSKTAHGSNVLLSQVRVIKQTLSSVWFQAGPTTYTTTLNLDDKTRRHLGHDRHSMCL